MNITDIEIMSDIKKIISEYFVYGKNVTYKCNYTEFDVDVNDYNLNYNTEICAEYTKKSLKNRSCYTSLLLDFKYEKVHRLRFKIIIKPKSELKFKTFNDVISWQFSKKPTQIIQLIKTYGCQCEWYQYGNLLNMKNTELNKINNKDRLEYLISKHDGVKIY